MAVAPIARRHIPEFDGLRGAAALAVVIHRLPQIYLPLAHGALLHLVLSVGAVGLVQRR